MKLLKVHEQILIENVDQFKQVYEVLRSEFSVFDTLEDMIERHNAFKFVAYVAYGTFRVSVFGCDPERETISFDQFMCRVTPPLNFWKWAEQNAKGLTTNENIEEYVKYRFEVGR